MRANIHQQIRQRRNQLGLKQVDMKMRIGMNQQQYQKIEAGGNASIESIERIAEGLQAEIMLIPKENLSVVLAYLGNKTTGIVNDALTANDPWSDYTDAQS